MTLARNETRIERNETRLERNETRLARNETRGGNLHLGGTVADQKAVSSMKFYLRTTVDWPLCTIMLMFVKNDDCMTLAKL